MAVPPLRGISSFINYGVCSAFVYGDHIKLHVSYVVLTVMVVFVKWRFASSVPAHTGDWVPFPFTTAVFNKACEHPLSVFFVTFFFCLFIFHLLREKIIWLFLNSLDLTLAFKKNELNNRQRSTLSTDLWYFCHYHLNTDSPINH